MSAADSGAGVEVLYRPRRGSRLSVSVSLHRHWVQLLLHHLPRTSQKLGTVRRGEGGGRRDGGHCEEGGGRREKGWGAL